MASYTDDEIKLHVQALVAKNAAPADIEAFVAAAKGVSVQGAPVTEAPSAKPPLATGLSFDAMRSRVGGQLERMSAPAADMGTVGGLTAAGAYLGTLAGPGAPVAVPVMSAIGAGTGAVLNSMRKGQPISAGEAAGASVAGLFPGQSLANAGARQVAKSAAAQGLANTAAKTAETGIDRGTLPTVPESVASFAGGAASAPLVKVLDKGMQLRDNAARAAQSSVRDKTVFDAVANGFTVSPAQERPSVMNKFFQSIGGKADTPLEASVKNVKARDELARRAVGLPSGAEITPDSLAEIRARAATPYQQLSAIAKEAEATLEKNRLLISDPHEFQVALNEPERLKATKELLIKAGANVDKLAQARLAKNDAWEAYRQSKGDRDSYAAYQAANDKIAAIESNIEETAKLVSPTLANDLKASRVLIAKTHAVERALNESDGHVSGVELAKMLKAGEPLTGELETIARFARVAPRVNRDAATLSEPGVSKLQMYASLTGGLAAMGKTGSGAAGAAVAAVPFTSDIVRKMILSKPYQQAFASPYHGPNIPDYLARAGRGAVEEAGRSYGRPIPYRQ